MKPEKPIPVSLEEFLSSNSISSDAWSRCSVGWEELRAIGADHLGRMEVLEETAEYLAKKVQRFDRVHSVRWRVKDASHLMAKIARKQSEGAGKYAGITRANYHDVITDLIGLRALHLFKSDCFSIDANLRDELDLLETPIAYVRAGDDDVLAEQYEQAGFAVRDHPHGYRSIHYVVKAQPTKRAVAAEIQVRTIFEEGWSEIDHTVRYPNFSDDPQVSYLLKIFNRLAGSADELGGFVLRLQGVLNTTQLIARTAQLAAEKASSERDASVKRMEEALDQLAKYQTEQEREERVSKLKSELAKFRRDDSTEKSSGAIRHPSPGATIPPAIFRLPDVERSALRAIGEQLKSLNDPAGLRTLAEQVKALEDVGGIRASLRKVNELEDPFGVRNFAEKIKVIEDPGGVRATLEKLKVLDDPSGVKELTRKLKGSGLPDV